MGAENATKTASNVLKLAMMMNSKSGTNIDEIKKTFGVSRATAFRMKKAAVEALDGRAEYAAEPPDPEDDHLFLKGAKKLTGKGRDWTYRIYSPEKALIFNDVGLGTVRALKTAHAHLTTAGLAKEAAELDILLRQVDDRLQC